LHLKLLVPSWNSTGRMVAVMNTPVSALRLSLRSPWPPSTSHAEQDGEWQLGADIPGTVYREAADEAVSSQPLWCQRCYGDCGDCQRCREEDASATSAEPPGSEAPTPARDGSLQHSLWSAEDLAPATPSGHAAEALRPTKVAETLADLFQTPRCQHSSAATLLVQTPLKSQNPACKFGGIGEPASLTAPGSPGACAGDGLRCLTGSTGKKGIRRCTDRDMDTRELGTTPQADPEHATPRSEGNHLPQAADRASSSSPPRRPAVGDLVVLGHGAPPEFRHRSAVVTKVAEGHCTVCVLDDSRRFGLGECWPGFADIAIERCTLRLGQRVVIDGLKSSKAGKLNGLTGTIIVHPREGHPCFVRTKAGKPQLTVCVRLEQPLSEYEKSVLLEPRFLVSYARFVAQAASVLEAAVAPMRSESSAEEPSPSEQSMTAMDDLPAALARMPGAATRAQMPSLKVPVAEQQLPSALAMERPGKDPKRTPECGVLERRRKGRHQEDCRMPPAGGVLVHHEKPEKAAVGSTALLEPRQSMFSFGVAPFGFWGLFWFCLAMRALVVLVWYRSAWEGQGVALCAVYIAGYICQWICFCIGGM